MMTFLVTFFGLAIGLGFIQPARAADRLMLDGGPAAVGTISVSATVAPSVMSQVLAAQNSRVTVDRPAVTFGDPLGATVGLRGRSNRPLRAHPIVIALVVEETATVVWMTTAMSDRAGQTAVALDLSETPVGVYRLTVWDLFYDQPVRLDAAPRLIVLPSLPAGAEVPTGRGTREPAGFSPPPILAVSSPEQVRQPWPARLAETRYQLSTVRYQVPTVGRQLRVY